MVSQTNSWLSDEAKKNLLPFVPPPCRRLSFKSVRALFKALQNGFLFVVDQVFVKKLRYTLYLVLYSIVWSLFIYFEVGALFFAATVCVVMYNNFEKRREGDLSAYSVFNPNQYRLLGESEIVNEILHRPVGTGLDGNVRENNLQAEIEGVEEDVEELEELEIRARRRGKKKKGRRRRQ